MRGDSAARLFHDAGADERLWANSPLARCSNRGHLTVRQRELVIGRTTARLPRRYEWGVHIAAFGPRPAHRARRFTHSCTVDADDEVWGADDELPIAMSDALHDDCDIGDALWRALRTRFCDEALLELLMLAGFYRTVSYLVNALRLPLEPQTPRFPA